MELRSSHKKNGTLLPTVVLSMKNSTFNFSALPYSTTELEEAEHVYELPSTSSATYVNIDQHIIAIK